MRFLLAAEVVRYQNPHASRLRGLPIDADGTPRALVINSCLLELIRQLILKVYFQSFL